MLLVPTYLAPSPIHGIGCFATEFISRGTLLAVFDYQFDRVFTPADVASLPPFMQAWLETYGYWQDGACWVNFDNLRFVNHSADPNTQQGKIKDYARRDIQAGEELTADYSTFDTSFDPASFT